ncbi:hypothetical protein [Arthrobacter pigmenti]
MQTEDLREALDSSFDIASPVAQKEIQRFLAWLRILTKQSWLGMAEEPIPPYGRTYLREQGEVGFLLAYGPRQSLTIRSGLIGATSDHIGTIVRKLESDEDLPPEFSLLADARFMSEDADVLDGHRAVLAAAMAAEIAANRTLRSKTPISRRPLVELVLARKSNVPDLVSSVAMATLGVSLKVDDPKIFRGLVELNTLRNQVVHTGKSVEKDQARVLVRAVDALFDWLENIDTDIGGVVDQFHSGEPSV